MRSSVTAARGLLSVATDLAGPESVSFGGGPGNSGSVGPLAVGTTLRGSSGHLDPAMIEISSVQSRVLSGSGSGDSSLGLVDVGIPAAADEAADAASVGDCVEHAGSTKNTAERVDSPSNRANTTDTNLDLTIIML